MKPEYIEGQKALENSIFHNMKVARQISLHSEPNSVLDADTAYADYKVRPEQTSYYVTTAVDSKGQQSAYSNETEVVIPEGAIGPP